MLDTPEKLIQSPFGMMDWATKRWRDNKPGRIMHSSDIEPHNKYRVGWQVGIAALFENSIADGRFNPACQEIAKKYIQYYLKKWEEKKETNDPEPLTQKEEIEVAQDAINNIMRISEKHPGIDKEKEFYHLAYLDLLFEKDQLERRDIKTQEHRRRTWFHAVAIDLINCLNANYISPTCRDEVQQYLDWFATTDQPNLNSPPISQFMIDKAKNIIEKVITTK